MISLILITMFDLNEAGVMFVEDIFTLSAVQLFKKYESLTLETAHQLKITLEGNLHKETTKRIQAMLKMSEEHLQ
jgi:hypothetical protein